MILCSLILAAVARAEYDSYKPNLMVARRAFNGVGFASYGAPVLSFGGYNGQMPVFGYGLSAKRHTLHKRYVGSVTNLNAELSVVDTMRSLLNRNDTMCLGLAVCQDARGNSKSASLLKAALNATSFLRGVSFVQYAIAQADFTRASCEDAFYPCSHIQPNLQEALFHLKRSVETRLGKHQRSFMKLILDESDQPPSKD